MNHSKIEIQTEQVTTVRSNGTLIVVVANDLSKRAQIISACSNMGEEEIKKTLELLLQNQIKEEKS